MAILLSVKPNVEMGSKLALSNVTIGNSQGVLTAWSNKISVASKIRIFFLTAEEICVEISSKQQISNVTMVT
jgi:hypothetical protein